MTDHARWMSEALAMAVRAANVGEVPVGAVVVRNGELIAKAHNKVESLGDPTAHAEVLALRRAGEVLGTWRLNSCSLYVTLEPCPMCVGAILLSRLDTIYFGCEDSVMGACGSAFDITSHPELPHQVACHHGLLATQSQEVLTRFFAMRRKESSARVL
jgi:tRNA(adenine34) deaminase